MEVEVVENVQQLNLDPMYRIKFSVFVSKEERTNFQQVGIRGSIPELGNWDESVPLEQVREELFVGSVSVPKGIMQQTVKNACLFEYKYCLDNTEGYGQVKWEDGNNRVIKMADPEFFDVWRTQPFVYQNSYFSSSHSYQTRPYQSSTRPSASPYQSVYFRHPKAAYKTFACFLFESLMGGDITPKQTFSSYQRLTSVLKDSNDISASQIDDFAEEAVADYNNQLIPMLAVCLCFIQGSSDSVKSSWEWSRSSNYSGWWNWNSQQARQQVWTKKLIELLSIEDFYKETVPMYDLSQELEKKHLNWIFTGLKTIFEKEHATRSYAWMRLIPFAMYINKINTSYRSISAIEPDIMTSNDCEECFKKELDNLVQNGLFHTEEIIPKSQKYPLLRCLIRNSPTLSSLLQILKAGDKLPNQEEGKQGTMWDNLECWTICVEGIDDRIRDFKWPHFVNEQKLELKSVQKILLRFPLENIVKTCCAILDNKSFSSRVSADKSINLLVLGTEALEELNEKGILHTKSSEKGGLQQELTLLLGVAIQNWLCRVHIKTESETIRWERGRKTIIPRQKKVKDELSVIFKTYTEFVENKSLKLHHTFFRRSLSSLLQLLDDRRILGKELDKQQNGNFHILIMETFEQRAISAVSVFAETENGQIELFNILKKLNVSGNRYPLKDKLLYELLKRICSQDPNDLLPLFKWTALWIKFFAYWSQCGYSLYLEDPIEDDRLVPIWHILALTRQTLNNLRDNIVSGDCTLNEVQATLKNQQKTKELMQICQIEPIDSSVLQERKKNLSTFEEVVGHLQCFVNIFCSSFEVNFGFPLPDELIRIRKNWDNLVLNDVKDLFLDLPIVPHLEWLYLHRSSELFLVKWTQFANTISLPNSDNSNIDNTPVKKGIPPPPPMPESQDDPLPFFGEQLQDENGNPIDLAEQNVPKEQKIGFNVLRYFTLEEISNHLVTAVKEDWIQFYEIIDTCSITFPDLEKTFGLLDKKHVQREVEILAKTGQKNSYEEKQWQEFHCDLILNFLLLDDHRKRLDYLISLMDYVKPIFQEDYESKHDPLYLSLLRCHDTLAKEWLEQTLENTTIFIEPVMEIFEGFSELKLKYLDELCKSPQLIEWFLNHSNTNDFNRLISITKSNTDDAISLRAIASLLSSRNLLSKVLYPEKLFYSLKEFLNTFIEGIEIDTEKVVDHLKTANDQFGFLLKLFEERTASPGMQACYTLKQIMKSGSYVWATYKNEQDSLVTSNPSMDLSSSLLLNKPTEQNQNQFTDPELTLKYVDEKSKIIDAEGKEEEKIITLSSEELIDLRNRLILAEVPTGEEFADLPDMISLFIEQLRLLLMISTTLDQLFKVGHFNFQNCTREFSTSVSNQELMINLSEFDIELKEWTEQIQQTRSDYYFLNYFTSNEILTIISYLDQPISTLKEFRENKTQKEIESLKEEENRIIQGENRHLDTVYTYLQFIKKDVDKKVIEQYMKEWTEKSYAEYLENIEKDIKLPETSKKLFSFGIFLQKIFEVDMKPVSRIISEEIVSRGSQYVFDKGTVGPFIAICPPEKVLDLCLTLYVQKGRIAEAEEVLFCNSETTLQDVYLLLLRWSKAALYGRSDRLYCVVNIEELNYTVQSQIAEYTLSFPLNTCSTLVFISSIAEGQHLVNALSSKKLEVTALEDNVLKTLYSSIVKKYHKNVVVFRSENAGHGKSMAIKGETSDQFLAYRHIPINGSINSDELIKLFNSNSRYFNSQESTAFHVDIGSTVEKSLNSLLFQLIVIGVLHDSHTSKMYHSQPEDAIFLEISNSFMNNTWDTVYFCRLLPEKSVAVGPDTLILDSLQLNQNDENATLVYSRIPNYELQFVCKFLQAFSEEKFMNFEATDEDFHPDLIPDLKPEECFALLLQYCQTDATNQTILPSFILFSNFVKYLFNQFIFVCYCDFFLNITVAGALGRPDFKHFMVQFLIRTSFDFASRSVKKKEEMQVDSDNKDGENLNAMNDQLNLIVQYTEQFQEMKLWNESEHPFVFFNQTENLGSGIGILSLNPGIVDTIMSADLKETLVFNGFNFNKDYTKITTQEGLDVLETILGFPQNGIVDPDYVLTIDNVMKALSIQLRLKYGIPVIIMGETGCGKTALVRFLSNLLDVKLFILNVHGGIDTENILEFMKEPIELALSDRGTDIYIFFDEINTSASMSLFKNIVCDQFLEGHILPSNLKFIAACNPYKLNSGNGEDAGLIYEDQKSTIESSFQDQTTIVSDPLKSLVYRVHPLPETMLEYVWDYGSLNPTTETLYISSLLERELRLNDTYKNSKAFVHLFTKLISASHAFIRETGISGTVSLRDVGRCITLFNWFLESLKNRHLYDNPISSIEQVKRSLVLTLAHCYHSRLSTKRKDYRRRINDIINSTPPFEIRLVKGEFSNILRKEQMFYIKQMITEDGIALNDALCENIFMILVCMLNKVPIFVVGKPGSSKSLAVELISSNLNGKTSVQPFFQDFPAVEVFSYQCSPLSTSMGIEQTFQHAIKYQMSTANTIVVVLLDEVGLAEQSPHLPLKVLHNLLEKPEISVVGISNWALDLAKMNRAIHLTRPEPGVNDLKTTAMGIVSSLHLEASLKSLAEAYYNVYKTQKRADFFGLRDFYQTIKYLHRELDEIIDPPLLARAIYRNFGGRPSEMNNILHEFFSIVGLNLNQIEDLSNLGISAFDQMNNNSMSLEVQNLEKEPHVIQMIKSNLLDKNARHLMLLTQNISFQILFDLKVLDHQQTVVLFGSDFPGDQTDLQICVNIQNIKTCMAEGRTVVLVHCENLYESLYDMLNQHYTSYEGQRFVRIALGTHSRLCPVHENFRLITVASTYQAYHILAPPLLNRFEKQVLLRQELLSKEQKNVVEKLKEWINEFVKNQTDNNNQRFEHSNIFVGFNQDSLSSLVLSLSNKNTQFGEKNDNYENETHQKEDIPEEKDNSEPMELDTDTILNDFDEPQDLKEEESITKTLNSQQLFEQAKNKLLYIATPESVVRATSSGSQISDVKEQYFARQIHTCLKDLLSEIVILDDQKLFLEEIDNTISTLKEQLNHLKFKEKSENEKEEISTNENEDIEMKESNEKFNIEQEVSEITQQIDSMEKQREEVKQQSDKSEDNKIQKQQLYWTGEDDLGILLTVLTFSPVSENITAIISSVNEKIESTILKLHEFTSASEVTSSVHDFFTENSEKNEFCTDEILVIQCDPIASSLQRINHAKYICEKERSDYLMNLNSEKRRSHKHIILLIHLNRTSNSSVYTFDFDKGWFNCLLDDIRTPNQESGLELTTAELLRGTELELIHKMQLKATLKKTFRSCLARLIYPQQRISTDIQDQIGQLLNLFEDKEFMTALQKKLYALIKVAVSESKSKDDSEKSWQQILAQNLNEISVSASFNTALKEHLENTVANVFTQLLCHIDRNNNLIVYSSLNKDNEFLHDLWISMFLDNTICSLPMVVSTAESFHDRYDVISDSNRTKNFNSNFQIEDYVFNSKFPFSFVLINTIEAIRVEAEKLPGSLENSLGRLLDVTFPELASIFSGIEKNQKLYEFYLHDFIHHVGYSTNQIDINTWLIINSEIIKKSLLNPNLIENIFQIHISFWKSEKKIRNILQVLDVFPIESDIIFEFMKSINNLNNLTLLDLDLNLIDLVLEKLIPNKELWKSSINQQKWFSTMNQILPCIQVILEDNLSLNRDNMEVNMKFQFQNQQWKSLLFLRSYLKDLAFRHDISTSISINFAKLMLNNLDTLKKETFDKLVDFISKKLLSQKTTIRCNLLIETFVSHFCLTNSSIAENLEKELLLDFIKIISDTHPKFESNSDQQKSNSPVTGKSNLKRAASNPKAVPAKSKGAKPKGNRKKKISLIGTVTLRGYLLKVILYCVHMKSVSKELISFLLENFESKFNNLDIQSSSCILYMQVIEDIFTELLDKNIQQFSLNGIEKPLVNTMLAICSSVNQSQIEPKTSIISKLESFGKIRAISLYYSQYLIDLYQDIPVDMKVDQDESIENEMEIENQENLDSKEKFNWRTNEQITYVVLNEGNRIFSFEHTNNAKVYLLKQISQKYGIIFVQNLFDCEKILQNVPWLNELKKNNNEMNRFLRKKYIITHDPFCLYDSDGYKMMQEAFKSAVDGDFNIISEKLQVLLFVGGGNSHPPSVKTSMIQALFSEVQLLYVSPDSEKNKNLENITNWILNQNEIPFTQFEKNLFSSISSNKFLWKFLSLNQNSNSSDITLFSVIIHIISITVGFNDELKSHLFYSLLYKPSLASKKFIPTMPEDLRQAMIAVLGGGWYECPNGHTYYVDQCGKPTEILDCATCGAKIGGLDHVLDEKNKEADKNDRTQPGYLLEEISEEINPNEFSSTERDIAPASFHFMRLIIHSLLLVASSVDENVQKEVYQLIFHKTFPKDEPNGNRVCEFLTRYIKHEWQIMITALSCSPEDLGVACHLILRDLSTDNHLLPDPLLNTLEQRNNFEKHLVDNFVSEKLESIQNCVQNYYKSYTSRDFGILNQLRETLAFDENSSKDKEFKELQPLLWRYRTPVSLSHLQKQFDLLSEDRKANYGILKLFLTRSEQLEALKHLRSTIEFQRLLIVRFDKRIDREFSRETTIDTILKELPSSEKNQWEIAFEGFKNAWNSTWKYVDRFVCQEIPTIFKSVIMSKDTPLCFALPDDKDEGVCPFSLLTYLMNEHNQYIEIVCRDQKAKNSQIQSNTIIIDGDSEDEEDDLDESVFRVPSHLLTDQHMISYNVQNDLLPFLQINAVQNLSYGKGTSVSYNFESLEQHLIDSVLIGRPLIDLEIRKFNFANETRITGAIASLSSRIPQIELSGDVKERVLNDLGSLQRVGQCKRVLEICIGFLSATGGTNIKQLPSDLFLNDYITKTLLLSNTDIGNVVAKFTQLQHVISLWRLLDDQLNVDPFVSILAKYKEDIPKDALAELVAAKPALNLEILANVIKEYMLSFLVDSNTGSEHAIKDVIGYRDCPDNTGVLLNELNWFEDYFPTSIKMKHTFNVYLEITK